MAANTIFRCLFGALLPLAGNAMFDTLGVGWGNSVLGFISAAFLPLPLILYFYGERIRESRLFKMEFRTLTYSHPNAIHTILELDTTR